MFKLINNKIFNLIYTKINNIFHLITIGKIYSGILHDLMSPINSLLIYTNSIQSKDIQETNKYLIDFINTIQSQIKNQDTKEYFYTNKAIQESILLIKYKALSKNIRILFISDFDKEIYGNKNSFIRVLMNIISNAIDSYEKIESPIKDVIIKTEIDLDFIYIKIIDKGCGICKKDKNKIFRYFYSKKKNGSGIGLAFSNQLIKKDFRGKILINSILNHGSTFTIQIPIKNYPQFQHSQKNCLDRKH